MNLVEELVTQLPEPYRSKAESAERWDQYSEALDVVSDYIEYLENTNKRLYAEIRSS